MNFDEELGARVRRIRQQKHVSQNCLGHWLGVTFQQIQKYESGATRMPAEKLAKCAVMFGVPVGYFFGLEIDSNTAIDQELLEIAAEVAKIKSMEMRQHVYQIILALQEVQPHQKVA
jgi:transcriptional regulator with XRE-family HTH domain